MQPETTPPNPPSGPAETDEQVFVSFHYQEVKDLGKQFLTLISATLVFSVTFAEKILPFASATRFQKALLSLSWLILLASLAATGFGIYVNYLAASKAKGSVVYEYQRDFRSLARMSYAALDLAAILYGLSLFVLATIAGTRLLS